MIFLMSNVSASCYEFYDVGTFVSTLLGWELYPFLRQDHVFNVISPKQTPRILIPLFHLLQAAT